MLVVALLVGGKGESNREISENRLTQMYWVVFGANGVSIAQLVWTIARRRRSIVSESEIDIDFDYICCASGTGTTIAGIASNLQPHQQAIGFPVLKGGEFLYDEIKKLINVECLLITEYHFGGYAKTTPALIKFIKEFYQEHQILLDYVYTGKLLYGIFDLISKNYFPENATIIAVHTGGVMNANVFDLQQ